MNLKQRESELLALTDQQRDEGDESHPILHAEAGPNRFEVMSLFFPEEDGVKIEKDLDLDEVRVYYFNNEGQSELTEGALYDWALNYYEENF
jgi:hypothetical protein